MGGNIGPRMEIRESSALPIPIVLRLHQSYIKRKLRVCRVQKCIALAGAEAVLTSAGTKLPRFMVVTIGPRMEIYDTSVLPIPKEFLICGDFNARCGTLKDTPNVEEIPSRIPVDKVSNQLGKELIETMRALELCTLNGRFDQSKDNFTSVSSL